MGPGNGRPVGPRAALTHALHELGLTPSELERELDIESGTIAKIIRGAKPSPELAKQIETSVGVPHPSWEDRP